MKTKSKNLLWDPKFNILQCNEGLRGQSVFFTGLKAREVGSFYRIAILRQAEPHRQKNAFCVLKRRVKKTGKILITQGMYHLFIPIIALSRGETHVFFFLATVSFTMAILFTSFPSFWDSISCTLLLNSNGLGCYLAQVIQIKVPNQVFGHQSCIIFQEYH